MQTSTPSSMLGSMLAASAATGQDFWSAAATTVASSDTGAGQLSLTNQQVTTLASLLDRQTAGAGAGGLNSSESSALQISEDDELKLLNFPPRREDLTTAIPLTVIFGLLLVTGCIGNICTAIVIARPKNKYMHTATNYYLFSLAMSDLLFLVLGLPQEMYTLWQRYPSALNESVCIIRGYLSEASTYASILTISAFTIERYVAICHPLWAHTMSQLPRAITSIVFIWIMAAICAIPPAAELGIVTQRGPLTNRTLEQSAQCATKRTIYENMFVVSAIVFFIVPMIIVTVLYILIAIELRRSSKMNNAISKQTSSHLNDSQQSTTSASHNNNNSSNNNHHRHHHHHRHQPHHNHHHHHHNHHSNHTANHHKSSSSQQHQPHKHRQHHRLAAAPLRHQLKQQHACGCHNPATCLLAGPAANLTDANLSRRQLDETNCTTADAAGSSSLMANIMSQRPSSAIGNEQAPPCCPLLQPPRPPANCRLHKPGTAPDSRQADASNGSLSGSWTRLPLPALGAGAGTATAKLCNNFLRLVWSYDDQKAVNIGHDQDDGLALESGSAFSGQPARAAPEVALPTTQADSNNNNNSGNKIEAGQDTAQAGGNQHQSTIAVRDSHESLSRQPSPLSYHESLIQRAHAHQQQPAHLAACPLAKNVVQHQSIDNMNLSKILLASGAADSAAKCTCGPGPNVCCTRSFHATSSGMGPCGGGGGGGGGLANQARQRQQQQHQLSLSHLPGQRILLHNKQLNHHYLHHAHQCQHHHHNHRLTNPIQHQHQQHSRRSNAASSKKSVIRMLVAVVVSFFICWVPFHAQRLLASYLVKSENQNQFLIDIYLKLTYISGVMYYLSSTINPLLYQLMSAKFRLAFKETFKCSLFTCAFFARRSSMATTATNGACPAANHSPTNSIREPSTNLACNGSGHANHQHQQNSLCSSPIAKANSCLLLACSNADLHRQDSASSRSCQCSLCTCPCCCCESIRFVQPLPPASALARLRGRLNSSLASLLKLGTSAALSAPASKLNTSCSCQTVLIGGSANTHSNKGGHDFAQMSARDKEKMPLNGRCTPPLVQTPTTTTAAASDVTQQTPKVAGPQQVSCSRAPLLSGQDQEPEVSSRAGAKDTLQLANLQTNFPTHHTMLKFIRSPTPTGSCNQPTILQSLTRVSSREDDEESAAGHSDRSSASKRNEQAASRQKLANKAQGSEIRVDIDDGSDSNDEDDDEDRLESSELLKKSPQTFDGQSSGAIDLVRLEMGALIRPTAVNGRDQKPTDEEEDANENDDLLVTTSTEPSSCQSSAGTSPDQPCGAGSNGGQLAAGRGATRGYATNSATTTAASTTTTTTTTTASSSSSQLSIPSLNFCKSKYHHLSGMRAEFGDVRARGPGSGGRQQLAVSKSAKSRSQHQSFRHNKWQQLEDLTPMADGFADRQSARRRSLQQTLPQYAHSPPQVLSFDRHDGELDADSGMLLDGNQHEDDKRSNKLLFSENGSNFKSATTSNDDMDSRVDGQRQQHQHEKRHRHHQRHRKRSMAAPRATVETISGPPPPPAPAACETNGTNISNGNNYLSSSVSSSEIRLDLMSSKRLSMSTTTTSVLDDNSYQLTTNSQLTSSNPNLAAPRMAKNGSNAHMVSLSNCANTNTNFNNTSNEDEQEDIEIEEDPSTVINMQAFQSDLVNCSLSGNETVNLIANEANQLA